MASNNPSGDEEERLDTVFCPALEQFGPHIMKKCSILIRQAQNIDDAVRGGYKSIDMAARPVGIHNKSSLFF